MSDIEKLRLQRAAEDARRTADGLKTIAPMLAMRSAQLAQELELRLLQARAEEVRR